MILLRSRHLIDCLRIHGRLFHLLMQNLNLQSARPMLNLLCADRPTRHANSVYPRYATSYRLCGLIPRHRFLCGQLFRLIICPAQIRVRHLPELLYVSNHRFHL